MGTPEGFSFPGDVGATKNAPLSAAGVVRVTAIVPVWNRLPELKRCVNSLLEQEIPPWIRFQIAILDDGSTDGTDAWLAEQTRREARLLAFRYETNQGPGVARNALLRATQSEYVLLIDSDAYVQSRGAVAALAQCLRSRTELAAVSGIIYSDDRHENPPFLRGGYVTPELHGDLARWRTEHQNPHFLSSCFSLWRRERILETGGYDPFYRHGIEDIDVTLRIAAAGWKFEVFPEISAVHEMTNQGRLRRYDDFERVFRYLEWTRPYLHLRLHGWPRTLLACARWLGRGKAFEAHYGCELGWRRRFLCQVLYPLVHLAVWPVYGWPRKRRNFIQSAPAPRKIPAINPPPL